RAPRPRSGLRTPRRAPPARPQPAFQRPARDAPSAEAAADSGGAWVVSNDSFSWSKPQAVDAYRVREVARADRSLPGTLQFADGERSFAAGDPQAVVGEA